MNLRSASFQEFSSISYSFVNSAEHALSYLNVFLFSMVSMDYFDWSY